MPDPPLNFTFPLHQAPRPIVGSTKQRLTGLSPRVPVDSEKGEHSHQLTSFTCSHASSQPPSLSVRRGASSVREPDRRTDALHSPGHALGDKLINPLHDPLVSLLAALPKLPVLAPAAPIRTTPLHPATRQLIDDLKLFLRKQVDEFEHPDTLGKDLLDIPDVVALLSNVRNLRDGLDVGAVLAAAWNASAHAQSLVREKWKTSGENEELDEASMVAVLKKMDGTAFNDGVLRVVVSGLTTGLSAIGANSGGKDKGGKGKQKKKPGAQGGKEKENEPVADAGASDEPQEAKNAVDENDEVCTLPVQVTLMLTPSSPPDHPRRERGRQPQARDDGTRARLEARKKGPVNRQCVAEVCAARKFSLLTTPATSANTVTLSIVAEGFAGFKDPTVAELKAVILRLKLNTKTSGRKSEILKEMVS